MAQQEKIELQRLYNELEVLNNEFPEILHGFRTDNNFDRKKFVKKDYENLIDRLNSGSGPGTFNFYPSDKTDGACHKFCFGIATKKFGHNRELDKNRTGFKGLIKDIIGYWLSCGNINQTTIIHTLDWDEEDFVKDWEDIINHYRNNGKNIKIYEISEREGTATLKYPI